MGHEWDRDGERCLKCGDKDWFAGPECSADAPPKQKPVAKQSEIAAYHCGDPYCGDCPIVPNANVTGAEPVVAEASGGRSCSATTVGDEMIFDMGRMTSAATTATSGGTLTLDGLLAGIEKAKRELEQAAPMFAGGSLRVRESQYATKTEPTMAHKKRRNQSEAYHRRVQKKWTKRWGTKQVPCAYLVDNAAIGLPGRTLVAHPLHMAALRNMGPNVK